MYVTNAHRVYFTLRTILSHGLISGMKLAIALFTKKDVNLKLKNYPHKVLVRGGGSDPAVAFDTFVKNEYETPHTDEIELILDLGANVGYSAILFAVHYPNAKIISVEPDKANYDLLCSNTKAYSNVIPVLSGVWWRKANLEVSNPNEQSWGFQFEETSNENGVPCLTVNDLLEEYGSNKTTMIKMDVEGAEKEIFLKDSSWLKKTKVLQVEIHGCWKEVFDPLAEYDYEAKISGENIVVEFDHSVSK